MSIQELWERVFPAERRWLGLIIGISLGAHVLAMWFFEVRWPAPGGLPRRPLEATLWPSEGAGWTGMSLTGGERDFLELRDPGRIALPRAPLPTAPRWQDALRREEVFELPRAALKDMTLPGPEEHDVAADAGRVLERQRPSPAYRPVETPPAPSGTMVEWGGGLKEREVLQRRELPRPRTSLSLQVTVLQVEVNAEGMVETVVVDTSCRDASVDALAVAALRGWRFAPAEEPCVARVVVYWDFQAAEEKAEGPAGGARP